VLGLLGRLMPAVTHAAGADSLICAIDGSHVALGIGSARRVSGDMCEIELAMTASEMIGKPNPLAKYLLPNEFALHMEPARFLIV